MNILIFYSHLIDQTWNNPARDAGYVRGTRRGIERRQGTLAEKITRFIQSPSDWDARMLMIAWEVSDSTGIHARWPRLAANIDVLAREITRERNDATARCTAGTANYPARDLNLTVCGTVDRWGSDSRPAAGCGCDKCRVREEATPVTIFEISAEYVAERGIREQTDSFGGQPVRTTFRWEPVGFFMDRDEAIGVAEEQLPDYERARVRPLTQEGSTWDSRASRND